MEGTLFVPYFDGENYVALAHASFLRKLREDPDWTAQVSRSAA